MKCCTRKPLQQIIVLILIFNMRRQTTKSIEKFLSGCFAKMARSMNKKFSGTRMEVSGSRVVGRGEVGKGDKRGVKEHCYVNWRLQCQSRGLWEHFPALFCFLDFLTQFRRALLLM